MANFNFEFVENSVDNVYPKTLFIHNTEGGAVWQVYHIDNKYQIPILVEGAKRNGFMYVTLDDFDLSAEETFPTWRIDSARGYAKMFPELLELKDYVADSQLADDLYDYSAE